MKNINAIKITLISLLTMVVFSIIGLTYAYFSLEIEGTGKDISMTAGDLRLIYKDETDLKLTDAVPGDEVSKVITVTNAGTRSAKYSLYWGDLINTIENFELHATLDCKSYTNYGETTQTENGTCDKIYRAVPISNTTTTGNIKGNISIEPGITQEYTVTVKFDNKNYPQDDNMNKTFTGKIGIEEYTAPEEVNCTFNGELTQGAEYVNGQYTYRYKQQGAYSSTTDLAWNNVVTDGWGVQLTDKSSTESVTSKVCTYINNKPVISTSYMFSGSKATVLDVSGFDTSKVTNMEYMFYKSQATSINLSSFNTSKVANMSYMFYNSEATVLDVSSFDTSKVTNMNSMFYNSRATTLDLSNFDTSNVIDMSSMFSGSEATTLDVSNFDTSNVTDMEYMFYSSKATVLDVSGFDTSKVTNMGGMFYNSEATVLDVSSFDTSNVTSMTYMFSGSKAPVLDVSSFDTSKVKYMSNMFYSSKATVLDVSSFDTSKVTSMSRMFSNTQATILDVSGFDTSKVTNMNSMFLSSKATVLDVSGFDTSKVTNMGSMFYMSKATVLDVSNFDTSNVTNMNQMFYWCPNLTTVYVGNKFITDKVSSSTKMFTNSTKLVGGAGTVYNSSYVDKTYARVDGGTSSPGYFTLKTN